MQRHQNIAQMSDVSYSKSGREYDLEERLLNYAAGVIRLTRVLEASYAHRHVANQLLRAGTSPLANHGEAQAAESDADFLHKLKISLKELRESHRWLKLIKMVPLSDRLDLIDPMLIETDELERIFNRSVQTVQARIVSARRGKSS
jgi:four helix bundle protein